MPTIITRGAVSAKAYGFGVSSSSYTIKQSLRFRAAASAYLSRTPATATNRTTFTLSTWMKRGSLGNNAIFFSAAPDPNHAFYFGFSGDLLDCHQYDSGTNVLNLQTTAVFRDPSAWYHFMAAIDTTQATAANRAKLYVNGVQVTSFSTATYPSQNYATSWNLNCPSLVCSGFNGSTPTSFYDGEVAELNAIDGLALTPTSFGVYDSNGVWQPIKYGGAYGTNGYYLNFGNTSSVANLGLDSSGNGNTWTTNNLSLTAGITYDSMLDSPTNAAGTSTGIGNYCVMNPLSGNGTTSSGNLGCTGGSYGGQAGTFGMTSGKWYWEATGIYNIIGLALSTCVVGGGIGGTDSWGYITNGNSIHNPPGQASYGATYGSGDVIGIAFDATAGTLTFYKNGASQGVAFSGLTNGPYVPAVGYGNPSGGVTYLNFGQQPFTYTPPSGFKALNSYNLPTTTINNGSLFTAATLYTGTGASQSISNGANNNIGTTFQPDLFWIKNRNSASSQIIVDSVRGASNVLVTNTNTAESSQPNYVTSINSNGFTVGTGSGGAVVDINQSGQAYVGWQWKAGNSTSSNTSGTITSTVSVSTTAGFSVLTYTGNGTSGATVGHGLGVAPSIVLVKNRSAVADWAMYNINSGNTGALLLNTTGTLNASASYWNNTTPTSSVFTLGNGVSVNTNGNNYVAYCWTPIAGFSSFGTYTGNGSTSGPFVYTGFKPRWVMTHSLSAASNWAINDSSEVTYNVNNQTLLAENGQAVSTSYPMDFLSNGFVLRTTNQNNSGGNFIYLAFAENPFSINRAV